MTTSYQPVVASTVAFAWPAVCDNGGEPGLICTIILQIHSYYWKQCDGVHELQQCRFAFLLSARIMKYLYLFKKHGPDEW